ncbi:alpha/beta fold hydrolase [Microbacterium sp. NPDC055988]|uniref:alpha/beta fold hydrolase n=1 Tax=Microbacterium sp. NPDC055988 TaxID=3345671 RepID=UPI0035DA4689
MSPSCRRVVADRMTFGLWESRRPPGADSPSVVLVHGIGMSHRYLSRLHAVLADLTHVVSVDLPGFAGLPKPSDDPDVRRMGRALSEVIASLGEERIIVVGHSMGAQWAAEAVLHRPERVQAVVAIGPVVDQRHRSLMAQARALAVDTLGETPLINLIVFADYLRCGVPWYLKQARHMIAHPTEQRYAELQPPVLVIRGGDDPVAGRAWCRRLRDAARAARLVEVPGRNHVVQHSAPRAVAAAIMANTVGPWPPSARSAARRTTGGSTSSAC